MRIRKVSNYNKIRALHKEIFPVDECDIRNTDHLWKVEDDTNKLVGFCSLRLLECEPNVVFFNWAGLLVEARGKGLQKRMIRTREKWCRKNNIKSIITYTTPANIQSASSLLKTGYLLYIPDYSWAGENILYFIKDLY